MVKENGSPGHMNERSVKNRCNVVSKIVDKELM